MIDREYIASIRNTVNASIAVTRSTYLYFLLVTVYLALLFASTTDEDLLRGVSLSLPIINVSLPLQGIYFVAPLIYLILHLNILIQFFLLSSKLHIFEKTIHLSDDIESKVERNMLNHLPFSYVLITPNPNTITTKLMKLMVLASAIVFPISLLILTQVSFLPYHSELLTWWHRILIIADLIFVWVFWLMILKGDNPLLDWLDRQNNSGIFRNIAFSGVLIFFSVFVAVVPDGSVERITGGFIISNLLHRNLEIIDTTLVKRAPPPELIAEYMRQGKPPQSVWIDHSEGLDLSFRNLKYARFPSSRMYGANFSLAEMSNTSFSSAQLQGANFDLGDMPNANLWNANLVGANFDGANLQGANLASSELQGASFFRTDLSGAILSNAVLNLAAFVGPKMHAADLRQADLRLAVLAGVELDGANLQKALLGNVNLINASLDLADLREANFIPPSPQEIEQLTNMLRDSIDTEGRDKLAWAVIVQRLERRLEEGTILPEKTKAGRPLYDESLASEPFMPDWESPMKNVEFQQEFKASLQELLCNNSVIALSLASNFSPSGSADGNNDRDILIAETILNSSCPDEMMVPSWRMDYLTKFLEEK